ncbi:UNVERIFIED_CONTAM: hypothetical protein BEN50_15460 [Euhalothece sp. KZN 001]
MSVGAALASVLGFKFLTAITPLNTQLSLLGVNFKKVFLMYGKTATAGQRLAISMRTLKTSIKGAIVALKGLAKAALPLVVLTAVFEGINYATTNKLTDSIDAATNSVESYNSELKQLKDNLEAVDSAQSQWLKNSKANENLLIKFTDFAANALNPFEPLRRLYNQNIADEDSQVGRTFKVTNFFANNELKENFEAIQTAVETTEESINRVREATENAFSGSTRTMEDFRKKISDSNISVDSLNEGFQKLFKGNKVSADEYNEILNSITREIQSVNNELKDSPDEERADELEKQLNLLNQQKQVMTDQVRGVLELEQQLENLKSFESFINKYRSFLNVLLGKDAVDSLLHDINVQANAVQGEIDEVNNLLKDTIDRISDIEKALQTADFRLEIKGNFADIQTEIQKLAVWKQYESGKIKTEAEAQIKLDEIDKNRDITEIDLLQAQLKTYREQIAKASETVEKEIQQLAFDISADDNTGMDLTKLLTEEYQDALIEFARKVEDDQFQVSEEAQQVYGAINRIFQLRQQIPQLQSGVIQANQDIKEQKEDLADNLEETQESALNFSDSLNDFIRSLRDQIEDAKLELEQSKIENKSQQLKNELRKKLKAGSDSIYQGFVDLVSQFVDIIEQAKVNAIDKKRDEVQLGRDLRDNLQQLIEIRREALQEETIVISNELQNIRSIVESQTSDSDSKTPNQVRSRLNYEIGSYRNYAGYKPNPDATVEGLLPHHSPHKYPNDIAEDFILNRGANVPVPTPVGGTVTFAGNVNGYGNMVKLATEFGEVLLAHFKSLQVKTGQEVQAGQILGIQGTTGKSSGVHVHFEGSDEYLQKLFDLVSGKTPVTELPTLTSSEKLPPPPNVPKGLPSFDSSTTDSISTKPFNNDSIMTGSFEIANDKIFQLQKLQEQIFGQESIANAEQLKSRLLDLKDALANFLKEPEELIKGFRDTIKNAKDSLTNMQRDIFGTTLFEEKEIKKQETEEEINAQIETLQKQQETINQLIGNADSLSDIDSLIQKLENSGNFSNEMIKEIADELTSLSKDLTNGEVIQRLKEIAKASGLTAKQLEDQLPELKATIEENFLRERMDRINDARLQSMPEDDIFDRSRKDRFRREIESERILREDITPEEKKIKLDELAKATSTIYNELQPLQQSFATFFDDVTSGAESLGQAFVNMAKSIIDSLKQIAVETLANKVFQVLFGGLIDSIGGGNKTSNFAEGISLKSGFISTSTLPTQLGQFTGETTPSLFAEGGIVDRPTNAIIGEAGYPEAVIPMKQGSVPVEIDSEQIRAGDNYNIQISFNDPVVRDDSDLERISNLVDQKIRSQLINQKRPGGVLSR